MTSKKHLEYKPSGIEWVPEIPAHWETQRLKHISAVTFSNVDKHTKDDEIPVRLCNYVDVYYNEQITSDLEFMKATALPREIRKFALRKGDVIITKDSETWDDIAVPAYVPSDFDGIVCGYHLALIHPNDEIVNGEYLFRSFQARGLNDQFRVAATGVTRYGLGKFWLDNSLFLVPPLPEQRAIAAFLDRETAKIDTLIAKMQQLIQRLNEKRKALISHAVTKGLNPDAPMKESGVEWLGEIPAHWEIKRLKFLTSFVTSGSRWWAKYYSDSGAIFLRIGNVSRTGLDLDLSDIQYVSPPQGAEQERTRANRGDVLVSITAYIGSVGVISEDIGEAYISQHIALTRPIAQFVDSKWLGYCLFSRVGQHQFNRLLYGGSKDGLSLRDVENLFVLVPPLTEQKQLAQFVDNETANINALIAKIQTAIERLQEYRTVLISAAVTGKIDVRELV